MNIKFCLTDLIRIFYSQIFGTLFCFNCVINYQSYENKWLFCWVAIETNACWHWSFKMKCNVRVKLPFPLKAWAGLEGYRSLKLSEFLENQHIEMVKWRKNYKNEFLFVFVSKTTMKLEVNKSQMLYPVVYYT